MAAIPRPGRIAGWLLAAAALAAGGYILVASWATFNRFAVTRSLAYPPGWHAEILFWYALPAFEAGVLTGLLPLAMSRGVGGLLRVLSVAVWTEVAVNVGIVAYLVSRGALF